MRGCTPGRSGSRIVNATPTWTSPNTATWWLGALFGLVHVGVALTILVPLLPGVHPRMASDRAGPASTAVLEPPGLFGLNYGGQTPAVAVVAHLAFGTALGLLLSAH